MTSLELVNITPENWWAYARLKVDEPQQRYVASNPLIMARAYAYRHEGSQVWGIQVDGQPVGLLLEREFRMEGRTYLDLDQFMIAVGDQGRGYGQTALNLWLEKVKQASRYDTVILCYVRGNEGAAHLFSRLGFMPTGVEEGDEIVMQRFLK